MIREEAFMIVNLSDREIGVLKTKGEREVVASIKLEKGADESDNTWLIEQVKTVYQQYFSRVEEYREIPDSAKAVPGRF